MTCHTTLFIYNILHITNDTIPDSVNAFPPVSEDAANADPRIVIIFTESVDCTRVTAFPA